MWLQQPGASGSAISSRGSRGPAARAAPLSGARAALCHWRAPGRDRRCGVGVPGVPSRCRAFPSTTGDHRGRRRPPAHQEAGVRPVPHRAAAGRRLLPATGRHQGALQKASWWTSGLILGLRLAGMPQCGGMQRAFRPSDSLNRCCACPAPDRALCPSCRHSRMTSARGCQSSRSWRSRSCRTCRRSC